MVIFFKYEFIKLYYITKDHCIPSPVLTTFTLSVITKMFQFITFLNKIKFYLFLLKIFIKKVFNFHYELFTKVNLSLMF